MLFRTISYFLKKPHVFAIFLLSLSSYFANNYREEKNEVP
jgi:hypothetical protein